MPIDVSCGPVINSRVEGKSFVLFKSADTDLTGANVKNDKGILFFVSDGEPILAEFRTKKLDKFSNKSYLALSIKITKRSTINDGILNKIDDAKILAASP